MSEEQNPSEKKTATFKIFDEENQGFEEVEVSYEEGMTIGEAARKAMKKGHVVIPEERLSRMEYYASMEVESLGEAMAAIHDEAMTKKRMLTEGKILALTRGEDGEVKNVDTYEFSLKRNAPFEDEEEEGSEKKKLKETSE